MSKPGRNDPCSCGSGRKYKKCCGGLRLVANSSYDSEDRDQAMIALARYAARPRFADLRDNLPQHYWGAWQERSEQFTDESTLEMLRYILHNYLTIDYDLGRGVTIISELLEKTPDLPTLQRTFLEELARSYPGLYEIQEVRLDEGIQFLDLCTKESFFVTERMGTHGLKERDLFVARITQGPDDLRALEGDQHLFPAEHKDRLLSEIEAARETYAAADSATTEMWFMRSLAPRLGQLWLELVVYSTLPKMVTPGGDAIQFVTARFDVGEFADLETILNCCPALHREPEEKLPTWLWLEELATDLSRSLGRMELKDGVLTLETQSMSRFIRAEDLLVELLGEGLADPDVEIRNPWEMPGSAIPGSASSSSASSGSASSGSDSHEDSSDISLEEKDQIIGTYLDQHYRSWPDIPLPALSGKTPRAAVKLKAWRPKVIDLLVDFEDNEARHPSTSAGPYDFTWLWQELGLERPGTEAGAE